MGGRCLEDVLISSGFDILVAAITGIGGYYLRGLVESRKEKKASNVRSENKLKQFNNLFSKKSLSIQKDIIAMKAFYTISTMYEQQHSGYEDEEVYISSKETHELCRVRILENIEEILAFPLEEINLNYSNAINIIEHIKNTLINLKRIIMLKSESENKGELLEEVTEKISRDYQAIMDETRDLYK
jgi:hypothetical protein